MPFTCGLVVLKWLRVQMFHRETTLHISALTPPIPISLRKLPFRAFLQNNRPNIGLTRGLLNFTNAQTSWLWTTDLEDQAFSYVPRMETERRERHRNHRKHLVVRRWQLPATNTLPYTSTTPYQGVIYKSWPHKLVGEEKNSNPIPGRVNVKEAPNLRVQAWMQLRTCEVELSNKEWGISRGNRWNEDALGLPETRQKDQVAALQAAMWLLAFGSGVHFCCPRHPDLSYPLIHPLRTAPSGQFLTL